MKKIPNPEKQLAYLAYINRENDFQQEGFHPGKEGKETAVERVRFHSPKASVSRSRLARVVYRRAM